MKQLTQALEAQAEENRRFRSDVSDMLAKRDHVPKPAPSQERAELAAKVEAEAAKKEEWKEAALQNKLLVEREASLRQAAAASIQTQRTQFLEERAKMQHLHEELKHNAMERCEEVRQERSRAAAFLQMQEQAKAATQREAAAQHEVRQQQLIEEVMQARADTQRMECTANEKHEQILQDLKIEGEQKITFARHAREKELQQVIAERARQAAQQDRWNEEQAAAQRMIADRQLEEQRRQNEEQAAAQRSLAEREIQAQMRQHAVCEEKREQQLEEQRRRYMTAAADAAEEQRRKCEEFAATQQREAERQIAEQRVQCERQVAAAEEAAQIEASLLLALDAQMRENALPTQPPHPPPTADDEEWQQRAARESVPLIDVRDVAVFQPPPGRPAGDHDDEIESAIAMQILTETEAITERAQAWIYQEGERERLENDLAARDEQAWAWAQSDPTPISDLTPQPESDQEVERAINDQFLIDEQLKEEDAQLMQQMAAHQEQLEAEEDRNIVEQMVRTQEEAAARSDDPHVQPSPTEGSPTPLADDVAATPLSETVPVTPPVQPPLPQQRSSSAPGGGAFGVHRRTRGGEKRADSRKVRIIDSGDGFYDPSDRQPRFDDDQPSP